MKRKTSLLRSRHCESAVSGRGNPKRLRLAAPRMCAALPRTLRPWSLRHCVPRNDNTTICLLAAFLFIALFTGIGHAEESGAPSEIVGEAFGKSVTSEEFFYYYKTASLFTRFGQDKEEDQPRSNDDIRLEAWQNLIYSHEAKELGITISQEELEKEMKRLLAEKDIEYSSKEYKIWTVMQLDEDPALFERRIKDLLISNKLVANKSNPEVTVTEEEMKQKFLNQYNSFESEYIRFETKEEAEKFLKNVKANPRLWVDTFVEKKELGQKGSAWINIMSLEALIDLWKIPKDDAYRIIEHDEGDFIAAEFYYGDAVFRLLSKKRADMEKYTDKKQTYYRNSMTHYRNRKIVKDYFDGLLERADYRDFVAEARQEEKVEELKKKSLLALETNSGIIEVQLFPDTAPFACENFIGLVEEGYYDGIIFHRVIKDFMIQGGDPTGTGRGGDSMWKQPFVDEFSDDFTFDRPGLLAMANSGPNSNKSQFFITTKETPHLNKKHTIFGEVVSGYEVVKKIENTPVDSSNKPKDEQRIIKAYIKNEEIADKQ